MATLWIDVIEPATLSGYVRADLAEYETRKGSLNVFLPNREVPSPEVKFRAGQNGLVPEARFRAYDAEPEFVNRPKGKRVTIELPALGSQEPVTEYEQLLRRGQTDGESMETAILAAASALVRGAADRIERLRGTVIETGVATIDQDNFKSADPFGRDADLTTTAGALWSTATVDRMAYLETLVDLYRERNGDEPGALVMSNRVFRALASGDQFRLNLTGGGSRPSTEADVRAIITGAGLPDIIRYDRRTSGGRVTSDDRLFLLPAPVAPDAWESTQLGATFWGETLTSLDPRYGLADGEQPGIVAGVYRNETPPLIAQVITDAIALPVLANANLSLSAKVL